ncbi:MAG: DOMON domain-containing protein [Thermus sp.]|uniref:DOMON domain-containing protein n=1 Tax=Thermus sp. TaxID=275 RepID=UPI00298F378B|nr:DOMON domain-containing protein [Thermus sp.]MDW8017428.1 DOMON domain-containing protein [Thermus sp.]
MKRSLAWLWVLVLGAALAQAPKVDGKIAGGEYAKSYKHEKSGITLYWSVVGDTLYLALEGQSKGWIGIGFLAEKSDKKKGGDQYLFYMEGGKLVALDMYQTKRTGAPVTDDKEGGKNSILAAMATYEGEKWTVEFSRKLKTGETTDVEIAPGRKLIVMLAHAEKMDPKEEHKKTERWYLEDFAF